MGAGEPGLLDMALRLLPLCDCPKGRDKGPPVLVHANRMEPDRDIVAETGVVETEIDQRNISG